MKKLPVVFFEYVGLVERPDGKGSYKWVEGYSENKATFPWRTKKEIIAESKTANFKPSFN